VTEDVIALAVAACWFAAAVVIVWKRREPLAALTGSIAALLAVALLVDGAGGRIALGVLPAAGFHLLQALPDGRLGQRLTVRIVATVYALGVVAGAVLPYGDDGPNRVVVVGLWAVALAIGLPLANRRYRRASPLDRRRLQWFGLALAVVLELVLVLFAVEAMVRWPDDWPQVALGTTALLPIALAVVAFPGAVARVDRVMTHTLAVAGLTALVVVVYLLVVVGFGHRPTSSERTLLILSMVAAALVALLYGRTRDRLTDLANQLVYGESVAPDESVRTFASRMTRAVPMDELLQQLSESLRKTTQLAAAEVYTGSAGTYELAAGVPHVPREPLALSAQECSVVARAGISGGTWLDVWLKQLSPGVDRSLLRVAPIAHGGELLGLIVLERRPDSAQLSDDDDRVVTELARQVGLALHNVQLDSALQRSLEELQQTNDELQQSRLRIVSAGDQERRKLERNLHDGAQQHLVAMAVKLRLAEELIEEDPAEATGVITELRGNLKDAIAELRALAHGIFPPLLASGGLAEALGAAVGRSPLSASLDAHVGRYPAEIEASVYFCCLEAIQNAGKHAGDDAELTVTVCEDGGVLRFSVVDDGAGFEIGGEPLDGRSAGGHGFVNMADRLGAVGGRVRVASAPGAGTTVAGEIPIG
jgi:signal transduction histidine kinase